VNQDNIETATSGFISNSTMNKCINEGYKFVQKLDDSKIYDDNTEWDEVLYNLSEERRHCRGKNKIISIHVEQQHALSTYDKRSLLVQQKQWRGNMYKYCIIRTTTRLCV
jgi:hypothetical protein